MTKSSEPRQTEDVSVYTVAAATLERLEKLPLGSSDYLDFFNVGIAATGAVRVQSAAFVCPVKLAPVAEAVLHEFELCTKHLPRFGAVTGAIVALHGDSLDEYPALAECLRGPRGQRLIRTSVVSADDQGREIAKLTSAVAKQLHERNLLEPWSGHLAVTVPELEERLKAAKLRHEQHCQSEAHRQAGEVASAEVAELERERVDLEREWSERLRLEDREAHCRRESLAAWYSGKYAAYVFEIGPPKTAKRRMTGAEAAKNLLAGDEFLHYFAAQGSGTLAYRAVSDVQDCRHRGIVMTAQEAVDRLRVHLKGDGVSRLELREAIVVLAEAGYCPNARYRDVDVRGRQDWFNALSRGSDDLVSGLIRDLWRRISRFLDSQCRIQLHTPELNTCVIVPVERRSAASAVRREPTIEQLRALRIGLERHFGLNGYPFTGYTAKDTPPFTVIWDHPELLADRDANAITLFKDDGVIEVGLRTSAEPKELERTVVHEMTHVSDAALVYEGWPKELIEDRAYVRAALLVPLGTV